MSGASESSKVCERVANSITLNQPSKKSNQKIQLIEKLNQRHKVTQATRKN